MKRCLQCNDFSLYEDGVSNCPVCGQFLSMYSRSGRYSRNADDIPVSNKNVPYNNAVNNVGSASANASGRNNVNNFTFETRNGLSYVYRGIITEITPQTRLHSPLKKWANAIFSNEPYQLSNTSHSTMFRVMDISNGRFSRAKRDFVFFGDVEGRFFVGDDVTVTAKRRGNRYIVTNLHLNDTETNVRPVSIQIPALIVRLLTLFVICAVVLFICGVVSILTSEAFHVFLGELLGYMVCGMLIFTFIRAFFKR